MRISLVLILMFSSCQLGAAVIVWDSAPLEFTKPPGIADPTPEFIDQLTATVAITRSDRAGLYNPLVDNSYSESDEGPAGTLWAFESLNGNPSGSAFLGAANHEQLIFSSWESALQGQGFLQDNILDRDGVILIPGGAGTDDIALDIRFSHWGSGGGDGAVSYVRSTAGAVVSGPGIVWLTLSIIALLSVRPTKTSRKGPHSS